KGGAASPIETGRRSRRPARSAHRQRWSAAAQRLAVTLPGRRRGGQEVLVKKLTIPRGNFDAVAYTADGAGEVRLVNPHSGRQVACLNLEIGAIHGIAF